MTNDRTVTRALRKGLSLTMISVSVLTLGAAGTHAQDFTQPLRIIVPAAAGGSSDILARLIAPGMSDQLGQPVVVENMPGAANNVGLGYVAGAEPDGYTVALVDVGAPAISATLLKDLTYELETDLTGVTMVTFTPYILGISPDLPVEDAGAFETFVSENPGELVTASSGPGSLTHLTSVTLAHHWGAEDALHAAYNGISAAIAAVAGGEAGMVVSGIDAIRPFVESDQIRGIAVSGSDRLDWAPNLATFEEMGWPMAEMGSWQGIVAPAGTPDATIAAIHEAVTAAVKDEAVIQALANRGAQLRIEGPQHLNDWLERETGVLATAIEEGGVTAP